MKHQRRIKEEAKYPKEGFEGSVVTDFIFINNDLVDQGLISRIKQGSDAAISEALKKIHLRSLPNKEKRAMYSQENLAVKEHLKILLGSNKTSNMEVKSYAEAVKSSTLFSNTTESSKPLSGTRKFPYSIFIYNLPWNATVKEIWSYFKNLGVIRDIVLPKKGDKYNKRFDFLIPSSREEAFRLIDKCNRSSCMGSEILQTKPTN